MKRVDDLFGVVVRRVEVGRSGVVKLWLERPPSPSGYRPDCEWTPITVALPKEPRKRKK